MLKTKDFKAFYNILKPSAEHFIVTATNQDELMHNSIVLNTFLAPLSETSSSLAQAIEKASKTAKPGQKIIICGSLYLIGEVLELHNLSKS